MKKFFTLIITIILLAASGYGQEKVRIMTYNILNYPGSDYSVRDPYFKLINDSTRPDILVVNEINSSAGVYNYLVKALDTSQYKQGEYIDGYDSDNALYYKDSLFEFIDNRAISTSIRDISEFKVVHKITGDTLLIYAVHLKAGSDASDEQQRVNEVNILRSVTDQLPYGTNYMVLGDFNIYTAYETAFQNLISKSDSGYFVDPLDIIANWHSVSGFTYLYTQSTRTQSFGGGSTGGMDDRFDMILVSPSIMRPGGIDYVENSYVPYGNDEQHFNVAINDGTNTAVPDAVADALHGASDHLPVYAEFYFTGPNTISQFDNVPEDYTLYQNYPNPFNPTTEIKIGLKQRGEVKLTITDILGRHIDTIAAGEYAGGTHTFRFDARGLASGVYIYTLDITDGSSGSLLYRSAGKMLLMK